MKLIFFSKNFTKKEKMISRKNDPHLSENFYNKKDMTSRKNDPHLSENFYNKRNMTSRKKNFFFYNKDMTSKGNTTSDQVLKQTVSKSNLLDSEVPPVDSTPILKPKKYKRQYRKTGNFVKGKNKIKKRIVKIFDQFWKLKPGKSSESTKELKKSWYEKLKESIIELVVEKRTKI